MMPLDQVHHLYHTVLTRIEEVIFQTDTAGRWLFLSSPWQEITGYGVEETLNRAMVDYVFSQDDRDRLTDLLDALWRGERESFRCELRFATKNRNFRWLELYAQRYSDDQGQLLGGCGAINDVTRRKQGEAILKARAEQLNQQRQQIEAKNQALMETSQLKSQFLATMSHELRTPMNAIMGFSQMLMLQQYGPLSPRQVDMVERIFNNSQNLLSLLNEVLDFSKLEAGCWDVNFQPFDAARLIKGTVEELRSLAQKKNLGLTVIIHSQDPHIFSDQHCIRRILINLLANGIKFTPQGQVNVTLQDGPDHTLELAVQDTGIGIAPEDQGMIFEAFRQVDQTLTRKHPGTGLGLAIVKSLVQMIQGRITIASQRGAGATFTVTIPRAPQQRQIIAIDSEDCLSQ
ncbi:MAG: PAS domain-containing sensor histidine kinase [Spirulina sp. DLM2.Bin59]|nr:MAG: PAS domain-containing sensor histidine kinase [Spirulina sp. DLM2.Bin59]